MRNHSALTSISSEAKVIWPFGWNHKQQNGYCDGNARIGHVTIQQIEDDLPHQQISLFLLHLFLHDLMPSHQTAAIKLQVLFKTTL